MCIRDRHLFAFESYPVISPNNRTIVSDSLPQVKPIYRIDTISVFDYETFKETVTIEKTIIGDTIIVLDEKSGEETLSIVESTSSCYVIIIGNRAVAGEMVVSKSELKQLLENQTIKITPLKENCGKVENWSIDLVIIPGDCLLYTSPSPRD